MDHKTSRNLMIALGLAAALAASVATLQIVSAQGPTPAGSAGVQGLGGPEGAPGELPGPHLCPGCLAQSADAIPDRQGVDASLFSATDGVPGVRFVHIARGANTVANYTLIDHPLTNNNPNAIVFVTQNYNPGGVWNIYNNHPIGVWYSGAAQKWAIFNQDSAAMPPYAAFNVLIPTTGADAFVHTATVTNTTGNWTTIDHPLTNDNPNAIVLVTQNWNPAGGSGTYNWYPIGMRYSHAQDKWAVFNQDDTSSLPKDAAFNVLIPPTGANTFVHTATAANTSGHVTYINHPLTNDNPYAIVLVTQNWNPGGTGGTYNDYPIGVRYDDVENKWAIFNQDDTSSLPEDAAFNVLIPATGSAAFVHTATAANTIANYTYIDHPLTNDDPYAFVFVTQNWNPGGGRGTYNDHAIGVWYDGVENKWAIFTQDIAAMPEGAAFNVLIPDTGVNVFVHQATVTETFFGYQTRIKYFLPGNNRYAILFVTNNWNPGGGTGTYNDRSIGVLYNDFYDVNRWTIFNQCLTSTMPIGASFNVLIPETDASVFVHQAAVTNTVSNYTLIDHPLTNDNPNAIVFVTQNGLSETQVTFNDHHVGVWYNDEENKWAIFNQDSAAMPEGAAFSVLIRASKVYLPLVIR